MVLIRKLFLLTQNLDILPNDVFLTMKLYYYDDGKVHFLINICLLVLCFLFVSVMSYAFWSDVLVNL